MILQYVVDILYIMTEQIKSAKEAQTKPDKKEPSNYFKIAIPKLSYLRTGNAFLVIALIIFSFLLGMLTNKVMYLENAAKNSSNAQVANSPIGNNAQAPQAVPTEDLSPKDVSIDDDPVLGQENAKITVIDFTDYECPFCKRYFDQTFPQIKKEYIDTGKIKYVVRDLPLSFHANAPKEAQAAECARDQGGNDAYYKYHDEIFKRTTSNGTGLALTELSVIATDLGLNGALLQQCLDSDKYKAEVEKDFADAGKVGANGTPTFFIGKSTSNGIIKGTKLVGAQPFSAFKTEIDKQLK